MALFRNEKSGLYAVLNTSSGVVRVRCGKFADGRVHACFERAGSPEEIMSLFLEMWHRDWRVGRWYADIGHLPTGKFDWLHVDIDVEQIGLA